MKRLSIALAAVSSLVLFSPSSEARPFGRGHGFVGHHHGFHGHRGLGFRGHHRGFEVITEASEAIVTASGATTVGTAASASVRRASATGATTAATATAAAIVAWAWRPARASGSPPRPPDLPTTGHPMATATPTPRSATATATAWAGCTAATDTNEGSSAKAAITPLSHRTDPARMGPSLPPPAPELYAYVRRAP